MVNGQIWRDSRSGGVTLYCYINGSTVTYNLNTIVYASGSSGPQYNVGQAGRILPCVILPGGQGSIGVSDAAGYVWCPSNYGSVLSGRAGTINELAVISGSLAICIASGTSNNWRAIHI